ncbi:hypothetical protein MXD59_25190 [Frankia sp. Ag45/Mut15]|uniref:FAD-binding FR-type domain-containing protein n=1 Tax=Frankia umida TaxID=573489 RepID=A0ABT0K648_9ACTN|nr:hypothetical protein [Frankia umida]MCK9879012.1 hypothetical protein [Frankia umida]
MPSIPAPIADFTERKFGIAGTIRTITRLSPGLLRLQVTCPQPKRKPWQPGHEIELRVGERAFRHYSVMDYSPAGATDADGGAGGGVMTVLVHLHGTAPGTTWLLGRAAGDEVAVLGPGHALDRGPGERRLLLGDTCTIGTFAAMLAADGVGPGGDNGAPATTTTAVAGGVRYLGAVEVAEADAAAAAELLPGIDVVVEQAAPGEALAGWVGNAAAEAGGDLADRAHLIGHAGTIQSLRTMLRATTTLDRRAIVTKPYWATGKVGL